MTFFTRMWGCISLDRSFFVLIKWVHNDFMYVRFAGMRNTKTWSKSMCKAIREESDLGCDVTCFYIFK